MDYRQTLDYIYSQLPMFTRIGPAAIKKDLTNTIAFCAWLGNPQNQFRSVHVGGTNGKGSTSHMIAAVLQAAGYKTGLYTSPHLHDFRERIRINGEMIPEETVRLFVEKNKSFIDSTEPSFFETTVAMAFEYFADEQVDIAVIEVGLGGRLDSTNVITPLLSVITNISYDHMNLLGDTLEEIAAEKAGIIKPGVPVVIGEREEQTAQVFIRRAAGLGSPIGFADAEWDIAKEPGSGYHSLQLLAQPLPAGEPLSLTLDLGGSYQEKNIRTVLSAIRRLHGAGFELSERTVSAALKEVKKLTGLAGRWQVFSTQPLIIGDTAHNEAGIREVLKSIAMTGYRQLHIVIGMVADKDSSKILALLPPAARYYFCAPSLPRALPAHELASQAAAFGLNGDTWPDIPAAVAAARSKAGKDDLIFIGGSTFVVADAGFPQ